MHILGIIAIVYTIYQLIKEAFQPTIPAEYWANKDLMDADRRSGLSEKQIIKNLNRGRYCIPKEITNAYPVPHRERDGRNRIIIENDELYQEDVARYGAYQAHKWIEQGKYNLNREELEIVHLKFERRNQNMYSIRSSDSKYKERVQEIDAILATKKWDYKDTEAAKQWKKAFENEENYKLEKAESRKYY